jgi:hypothetical protein
MLSLELLLAAAALTRAQSADKLDASRCKMPAAARR